MAAAAALSFGAGCSSPAHHSGSPPSQTVSVARTSAPAKATCPASYAAPDPKRPVVDLHFALADDLATVTGTESVTFTPDLPVSELVFRLTANEPTLSIPGHNGPGGQPGPAARSSVRVGGVTVDGAAVRPGFDRAGAVRTSQGGLLRLPLRHRSPAGTTVRAHLTFTLALGGDTFDRFGHTGATAWWGSGQPLLAWERGAGWRTEPMSAAAGETATSEAARTRISVVAPADLFLVGTGAFTGSKPVGGRRTWTSDSATARDVAVFASGVMTEATRRVGTTTVTVTAGNRTLAARILGFAEQSLSALGKTYGPFPYPTLAIAMVDSFNGGIEYPGVTLIAGPSPRLEAHEIAHQYFYGMVGDAQARDPWLDEAFATYAQQVIGDELAPKDLKIPGPVGAPMSYWQQHRDEYEPVVYAKGAAMLAAARAAAGSARFDTALRCYVRAEAWKIARPRDVAAAFAQLPAALAVFRKAGAIS